MSVAIGLSPGTYAAAAKTATAKTATTAGAAASKTPAKSADASKAAKAVPAGPKVLVATPMVGVQKIISPDHSKLATPDHSKGIASAKSFTEQLKDLEKSKNAGKNEKPPKMRTQVVDGKVCVWGRNPEDAEMYAGEAVRKYIGKKSSYQLKDSTFLADSSRYICTLRFNYKDQMPDNWYLETEMVTGFGKTKERAYFDAMTRAAARAKNIQGKAEWAQADSAAKNSSELGVIPYDYVFATIGDTQFCKIYFRYFMPR